MKRSEMPEYSAHIITEYYKNNIQLFLDSLSENCLWMGPAQGQMIHTRKAIHEAFAQENHQIKFEVQNMQVIPMPINSTSIDVILAFTIISYYPNGDILVFQQRVDLLWTEENVTDSSGNTYKDFRIRVCHISNEFPYDSRDTIYPNHFAELDIAKVCTGNVSQCKFALKGPHGSYYYLSGNTIMWLERKGNHTLIHTINQVYESTETVTAITAKYSDVLCKIHASYAVNPEFISEIGRFFVKMDDGSMLSIPEKKYTATRDELNRLMEKRI